MPRHVISSQQLMSMRRKKLKPSPNNGSGSPQQSVGKKSLSTTIVRAVIIAVRTIAYAFRQDEVEPQWYLNERGVLVQDAPRKPVPRMAVWKPAKQVRPRQTTRVVKKAKLQTMLQDKIAVELELMKRRHTLQRQYWADQLKLQQGAEIAALQLQQNITKAEMSLMTDQQVGRGKRLLLPNVNVAFGIHSIERYSPEGCSPSNPIVFKS